jgi:hypothetical protein
MVGARQCNRLSRTCVIAITASAPWVRLKWNAGAGFGQRWTAPALRGMVGCRQVVWLGWRRWRGTQGVGVASRTTWPPQAPSDPHHYDQIC